MRLGHVEQALGNLRIVPWPQLLPRPTRLETTSPATKAAGLVTILRLICQQAFLCETSFLRDSPAKANKPMPNIVSIAGSGTAVGAFRLIVAPATLPLPPVGVPF